jgi:hypothetical protein
MHEYEWYYCKRRRPVVISKRGEKVAGRDPPPPPTKLQYSLHDPRAECCGHTVSGCVCLMWRAWLLAGDCFGVGELPPSPLF